MGEHKSLAVLGTKQPVPVSCAYFIKARHGLWILVAGDWNLVKQAEKVLCWPITGEKLFTASLCSMLISYILICDISIIPMTSKRRCVLFVFTCKADADEYTRKQGPEPCDEHLNLSLSILGQAKSSGAVPNVLS